MEAIPLSQKPKMIHTKRESAEWDLAHALDRHIGYTTGAFNLDRIAEVALYFENRATVWEVEIVNRLMKTYSVKENYATGILDFSVSLGFVSRFESTSASTRVSLTDLGRSYRSAYYCNNVPLQQLVLTYAVLAADCDFYGLLLTSFTRDITNESVPKRLAVELQALREKRISWLRNHFSDSTLRQRVTDKISWLRDSLGKVDSMCIHVNDNYARHHSRPRKGWARYLGHVDGSKVTPFGQEICNSICDVDGSYFWIGLDHSTLETLRLPTEAMRKPLGPIWNLLRPQESTEEKMEDISGLANFMEQAYPVIRLSLSNQASIDAVLPYLYMLERDIGIRYDEGKVFHQLFTEYRHQFAPMSRRSSLIGHYQLRTK